MFCPQTPDLMCLILCKTTSTQMESKISCMCSCDSQVLYIQTLYKYVHRHDTFTVHATYLCMMQPIHQRTAQHDRRKCFLRSLQPHTPHQGTAWSMSPQLRGKCASIKVRDVGILQWSNTCYDNANNFFILRNCLYYTYMHNFVNI